MTLDDLIEHLLVLRRAYPAAATATVYVGGDREPEITYDRGAVWIGGDDEDEVCV